MFRIVFEYPLSPSYLWDYEMCELVLYESQQDLYFAHRVYFLCWRTTFRRALNQRHMVPVCEY